MFIPVMDELDWASKLHQDSLTINDGPQKSGGFGLFFTCFAICSNSISFIKLLLIFS